MYSIGEFSKITGLTVKTLRFYHEQGLLVPSHVEPSTGYRFYSDQKVETARAISQLRGLEFSLSQIGEILGGYDDDGDILAYLERHSQSIKATEARYREIRRSLDSLILYERNARQAMNVANFQVEQKTIDPMLIAAIRMRGRYAECSTGFGKLGRKFGRYLCGKPMMLHYDAEYKQDDASFEVCFPVKKGAGTGEIQVRELPGGKAVTLLHQGPYDELARSYQKIMAFIKDHKYKVELPSREVYIKGPGMIFRGNPRKYLTEIQMMVTPSDA